LTPAPAGGCIRDHARRAQDRRARGDLPAGARPSGGDATVSGFARVDGQVVITLERGAKPPFRFLTVELEDVIVTRVNSSWSGGLPDEEVSLGFNRICWEYRRAPGAAAVRFCFDLSAGQLVEAPEDVVDG
jgi:hypothetical protein